MPLKSTQLFVILFFIAITNAFQSNDFFDPNPNSNNMGFYFPKSSANLVTNLTTTVGKTVSLNCSLNVHDPNDFPFLKLSSSIRSKSTPIKQSDNFNLLKLNPTWLKADVSYNQFGHINSYKTENIIVTRKGIIADMYRDKMKLITFSNNEKLQVLKISEIDVRDEGKYICREFNSKVDRLFYLNVLSPIKEIGIKFNSNSKFFRESPSSSVSDINVMDIENDKLNLNTYGGSNSVSIREGDELIITCTVNSSKPAANISIWVWKRHNNRRSIDSVTNELDDFDSPDSRKLEIIDTFAIKNKDLTLKTVSSAKFIANRFDSHKTIACIAENSALNEKWESKRILNVLYGPKCNKFQKTVYNTGINQTIELECHMSEANPPYLDFNWNFQNSKTGVKERMRSTGFISRINWTPRSESDFGEISCLASNGLDVGECKIKLELGGPPNPPFDCYHKENNKTIIIECKPGFDQGDVEVYFYLLKKKSNGALVEYARKRDSCSFLISNFILEEHLNDFYIYSSNKYGNNKEKSTKIIIENKDFLLKNSNKLENISLQNNRQLTIISGLACLLVLLFFFICCVLMRCKKETNSSKSKAYANQQRNFNGNFVHNGQSNRNSSSGSINFQEPYKYSAHQSQYNSKTSIDADNASYHQNKPVYDDKSISSASDLEQESNTNGIYDNGSFKKASYGKLNSKTATIRSPSLINNIQDLDMSPKSKKKSSDKVKEPFGCSRSLIDETTETESETYLEFNRTKIKPEQILDNTEDQKYEYYNKGKPVSTSNTLKSSKHVNSNQSYNSIQKVNIWYGNSNHLSNATDSTDEFSGISVDKPIKCNFSTNSLKKNDFNYKSFGLNTNKTNIVNCNDVFNDDQDSSESNFNFGKKDKNYYEWQKSKLYANETISLDVDDEKMVGILV